MKKRTFRPIIALLLAFGLLLGFSTPQGDVAPVVAASAVEDVSSEGLRELIDELAKEGEILSDQLVRNLYNLLTGVEHYVNKAEYEKAVRHMSGFNDLVNQLHALGIVTENGHSQMTSYANELARKWDMIYDSNRAMKTLYDLSVEIGPRAPGTDAEKEAAHYLKSIYESFGLDVELQEFPIRDQTRQRLTIDNGNELALGAVSRSAQTDENGVDGIIVDAGFGEEGDFPENTEGNIALIKRGNLSYAAQLQNAVDAGATGVVFYDPNSTSLTAIRPNIGNTNSPIPVVGLLTRHANELMEEMEKRDVEVNLYVRTETNLTSLNVIASKKPEGVENPEIVYITSHYDSVAFSPGANDDGTGTVTVVEMARILKDFDTDKEIRFINFGAEEIGLVGSQYYVANLPQEEIDRSIANFQFEMLASKYEPGDYLAFNTVDGNLNEIWDYTVQAFDKFGYDTNKLISVRRGSSDHVPFHNAGIMATCFNMGTASGGLEPEYHTPSDSYENVSQERLQYAGNVISTIIFDYLNDLAQNEEDLDEAA